jgi:hypothetical protein
VDADFGGHCFFWRCVECGVGGHQKHWRLRCEEGVVECLEQIAGEEG